jgi:ubiquinone/menaquinone biosynthesis C-methylase UbiE
MTTSKQWQLARDAAERYERILVPAILGPAARALVEWSDLRDGDAVLDVGCGTGAAARFAAEKVGASGRVAGVDVNAGMIDVAQSLPSGTGAAIEWFQNSAYELPFTEGEFDVVVCAQTLQFLEGRPWALAEMYRVLKPNGRVAVSLWCDVQESPYFDVLVKAVTHHIGAEAAAGLGAAFSLSDSETIRALFTEAGFNDLEAIVKQLDLDLAEPPDFVPRHVGATPMATGFDAAPMDARAALIQEVSERLAQYQTGGRIRVPFRMHLVMATR